MTCFKILWIIALLFLSSFWAVAQDSPKYVFAAVDAWLPYSSAQAKNGGLLPMVANAAFHKMGYSIGVEFPPWERALAGALHGEYSGIIGAWYTSDRAKDFIYSKPIMQNEIVIVKKADRIITYNKLSDLKPYKIGASNGSSFIELLKASGLEQNIDLSVDVEMSLKKLIADRDDLFVDEKLSVLQLINSKYINWKDKIQILSPPVESTGLFLVVSLKVPGAQKIIDDFNTGLQIIISDGTLQDIFKENGVDGK